MTASANVFLAGARFPTWSCSCGKAGSDDNFANRTNCRGCGREMPAALLRAARARAQVAENKRHADGKGGKRGGKGGGKSGGAPAENSQASIAKAVADALRPLQKELAALRPPPPPPALETASPETPAEESSPKQQKDERERLRKEIEQLKELGLPEDNPVISERRAKFQELAKQRPMATQISENDRRRKSLQDKLEKKRAAAEAAKAEIAKQQAALQEMVAEEAAVQKEIAAAEAERKQFLEEAAAHPAKPSSPEPAPNGAANWLQNAKLPEKLQGAASTLLAYIRENPQSMETEDGGAATSATNIPVERAAKREAVHLDAADVAALLDSLGLEKSETNLQRARDHIDDAICKKIRV